MDGRFLTTSLGLMNEVKLNALFGMAACTHSVNPMDALNAQLEALEKRQEEIQQKQRDLDYEEMSLHRERQRIEEERMRLSSELTEGDETQLKKELTAVGELLELPAVILGSLRVVSEEPDEDTQPYSIDIRCGVAFDTGVTGLSAHVTVKTKVPKVEAVVRSLFKQEGTLDTRCSPPGLYWERNWDYSTSIKLTTHEALSY